jgi:rod shape-determining protein MreC
MNQIFRLLHRYRVFLVFCMLELISFWLIVRYNSYQSASMFMAANDFFAYVYSVTNELNRFTSLADENEALQKELARLKSYENNMRVTDPMSHAILNHEFIPAKVIDNSILRPNNYLIINKGAKDGIKPGMGIVSTTGVVGRIKSCSQDFSIAYSVLHTNMGISSRIKGTNKNWGLCTTKWTDFTDPTVASLRDLPQHIVPKIGDTIVTSGFSGVFPGNYMIGRVNEISQNPKDGSRVISIRLSSDLSEVSYVYVIKTNDLPQLDSLKINIKE